jgi:hypothetical protein
LHRATKFSVGLFAIELKETTAKSFAIPALDGIQETASVAAPGDSTQELTYAINDEQPADYAKIDLGTGTSWLTSRLYLLATLGPTMRRMRAIVFEAKPPSSDTSYAAPSKFVGIVEARDLADALAFQYPWLKVALVKAYGAKFRNLVPHEMKESELIISEHGRLSAFDSQEFVQQFKKALQTPQSTGPKNWTPETEDAGNWTPLGTFSERATWVSEMNLRALLGDRLSTVAAVKSLSASDEDMARQFLRGNGRLVTVVNIQSELLSVMNRGGLLNRVARLVADQR